MSWGPGPAEGGQNFQNMPLLWRHLQKTPNQKRKALSSISSRRLAESVDGLDSSLVWGAVRKNIISDRFSTKTAIFAHILLSLHRDNYLYAHLAISVRI